AGWRETGWSPGQQVDQAPQLLRPDAAHEVLDQAEVVEVDAGTPSGRGLRLAGRRSSWLLLGLCAGLLALPLLPFPGQPLLVVGDQVGVQLGAEPFLDEGPDLQRLGALPQPGQGPPDHLDLLRPAPGNTRLLFGLLGHAPSD